MTKVLVSTLQIDKIEGETIVIIYFETLRDSKQEPMIVPKVEEGLPEGLKQIFIQKFLSTGDSTRSHKMCMHLSIEEYNDMGKPQINDVFEMKFSYLRGPPDPGRYAFIINFDKVISEEAKAR